MSRSVRFFLTAMFGLVVASGLYTGCSADECQTNADCTKKGTNLVCKLTSGAKKCVTNTTDGTPTDGSPDGTTADGTPDGTKPDGTPDGTNEINSPDGEGPKPDGEVITENPPTETAGETTPGTGSVGDICTQQQGNPTGTCQAGLICLGIF